MKKNRFAFNGTRRSLCESEVLCVLELLAHQCEIDAEKTVEQREKKSNFCGMPCDDYGCDIFN